MSAALGLLLVAQLNSFEFRDIPSPQYAGDSFEILVVAKDPQGGIYPFNGSALLTTTADDLYSYVYPNLIQFTNGVCQRDVIVTLADSLALRCTEPGRQITGMSNYFRVLPGPPDKLLPILPGEVWAPGSPAGKDPTPPTIQVAGDSFGLDVYVTDAWFNLVQFRSDSVYFSSSDPFAQLPSGGQLSNGQANFPVTMRRAGTHTITTSPSQGSPVKAGTSSSFTVIPGGYTKMLLILPGEEPLPGDTASSVWSTPGKSGKPNTQFVRMPFDVKLFACDGCWNRVSGSGDTVVLGSDFDFQTVPDRLPLDDSAVFSTQFNRPADNQNIWGRSLVGGPMTYLNWLDIRALGTTIDIIGPDSVRAGETAYYSVNVKDANGDPIVATGCRFDVVKGSGFMLDSADLTDTLGWCHARFLCTADHGSEHDTIKVTSDAVAYKGVFVERPDSLPMGAYPNPFGFNEETSTIFYILPSDAETEVRIYDPFGNQVMFWSFAKGETGAKSGLNYLYWDGRNDRGRRVANGIYVVQAISQFHTGTAFRKSCRLGVVW